MAIAEWIETARQLWDGPLKPVQDFWEIGAALVAGFAAYRVFRSRRIREMDSLLKGDRARRDDLTRKKEARTNALRRRTILAARLDGEIDELKTRTAEHALGRAAAERAELNHEAAARALADWLESERDAMASVAAELLKGDDGSDANRRRRLETIVAHATRPKPPTKGDRSASERA